MRYIIESNHCDKPLPKCWFNLVAYCIAESKKPDSLPYGFVIRQRLEKYKARTAFGPKEDRDTCLEFDNMEDLIYFQLVWS